MTDSKSHATSSSRFSEESQRQSWLLRIASGEILWAILTTSLAVLYGAVIIWRFYNEGFPGQHDDAYINYTYIDSFLRGYGLVFNQGEYVWGFTSPLQLLIMLTAGLIGLNVPYFADGLGIFWLVSWSVLLFQLLRTILPPVVSSAITLLMIFGWQEWLLVGLETNLLITCQLIFLLMITQKRPFWAGFFAAMACLARPDSLLLVVPLLLLCRETRKLSALAAFAIPGVLWVGFAWLYYDAIVPQSFHAKVGMTGPWEYFKGHVYYIADFAYPKDFLMITGPESYLAAKQLHWLRGFFALVLVSITFCNFFNKSYRNNTAMVYLVFFPWILLFAYSIIGSHPTQLWHLFSAYFFFRITLLAAIGFGATWIWRYLASGVRQNENSRVQKLRWGLACIAAVIVPSILSIQASSNHLSLDTSRTALWGGGRDETYRHISDWINRHVEKGASIAMIEVGTIGYYTDVRIVDHEGIVTLGTRLSEKEKLGFGGIVDTFDVDYLLLRRNQTHFRSDGGVEYQRVKYFPREKFYEMSLLKRVEPGDN